MPKCPGGAGELKQARAVPGSDPRRAWELVRPLTVLREAAVYQGFVDNIEPSERVYHLGDVRLSLEPSSALSRPKGSPA